MILLNVFALIAFAAAVLLTMTTSQDAGLERGVRFREAATALAAARGGEASAVTALRRDMTAAPLTDHYKEPWAAVAQRDVAITGGRFSLDIEDAQARFNVNGLIAGGAIADATAARVEAALKLPVGSAAALTSYLREAGPVQQIGELRRAGLDPAALATIAPYLTALPGATTININTVSEPLLALLLGDPVAARVLIERRAGPGFLTPADFTAARVGVAPGLGFTSDHYLVTTTVTIGGTTQRLTSLLERRRGSAGVAVVVIARDRG